MNKADEYEISIINVVEKKSICSIQSDLKIEKGTGDSWKNYGQKYKQAIHQRRNINVSELYKYFSLISNLMNTSKCNNEILPAFRLANLKGLIKLRLAREWKLTFLCIVGGSV